MIFYRWTSQPTASESQRILVRCQKQASLLQRPLLGTRLGHHAAWQYQATAGNTGPRKKGKVSSSSLQFLRLNSAGDDESSLSIYLLQGGSSLLGHYNYSLREALRQTFPEASLPPSASSISPWATTVFTSWNEKEITLLLWNDLDSPVLLPSPSPRNRSPASEPPNYLE